MIRQTGLLPRNEDNLILSLWFITPTGLPAASVAKVNLGRSKSGGYSPGLTNGLAVLRFGLSRVCPLRLAAGQADWQNSTARITPLSTVALAEMQGPAIPEVRLISISSCNNRSGRLIEPAIVPPSQRNPAAPTDAYMKTIFYTTCTIHPPV